MNEVLNTIVGLFRTPSMFIALVAMLGLILQKKSFSDIVKGSAKAFIGMLILTEGVNVLIRAISPLSNAFVQLFQIESTAPLGNFSDFLNSYGGEVGLLMLIGFIINIIIARFTRFKTIYLTANILYWYPMLFLAVGIENQNTRIVTYIMTAVFILIIAVIMPHLLRKHVKLLTGQDTFTIGHTASIYCLMGSYIGAIFGKNEKNVKQNTENLKLPKGLDFFKDTTLVSGFAIILIYVIVGFSLSADVRTTIFGGQPVFVVAVTNGMTFAAAMLILLYGVRLMLSEIVPAFNGIATKLAPGSIPAMDIPLIFPYGQNALLIGFLVASVSHFITILVLGASNILSFALIPLMVACYFDVAPGAIFANKRGGLKAVITFSVIGGVTLTLLAAVTIPLVANTVGTFVQAYGGNEFSLMVLIADFVAGLLSLLGI